MREGRLGVMLGVAVLLVLVLRALAWTGGPSVAEAAPPVQAEGVYKVVGPPGSLEGVGGARLVAAYGSFSLYTITGSALDQLDPGRRDQLTMASEMDELLLTAAPFNTRTERPVLPRSLMAEPTSGASLHLVQFVGPIKEEWLAAVEASGATLVHYVANNGYLLWADAGARTRLDEMARTGEVLQFSEPYHPYFKLAPSLYRGAEPAPKGEAAIPVVVQMVRHAERGNTEKAIRALALEVLSDWSPILGYQNSTLLVRPSDIATLARMPDVLWVGAPATRERMDEAQDQILAGKLNSSQSGPTGPGYLAWLDALGFSQEPGDYPIVDIVDDGIGTGSVTTGDPTFHRLGDPTLATRVAYVKSCTATTDGGGPDGHGHLNASIMGGYDQRVGEPYEDTRGFQRGLGVNPYGRLASTRVFSTIEFDISGCGNTDTGLIRASYQAGARVLSNSWGCGECKVYDTSAQAYDTGVRDADLTLTGNQQVVAIFAAGNTGPISTTVGSPGNAKNVITVGASENERPGWIDGCLTGDLDADNAMDVAPFSSRGPVAGERIKPEVVAPGTHIQGTASTHPMYNGAGVCDPFYPSDQTIFAASTGTSHSAPAVAGVVALYDYWLGAKYNLATPSPAMLKAYLIGHPTYLTGEDANDTLPSNAQGYGMPNLGVAFDETARFLLDQSVRLEHSGDEWEFRATVVDPSRPVRIVLVYTDQAGALGSSPQVNNLDLSATVAGVRYLGNHFSGQWSSTGGAPDTQNNYEAIFLPPGMDGELAVSVLGFNIAGDGVPNTGDGIDQDFAFLCYNCAQYPDFRLTVPSRHAAICAPQSATYRLQLSSILDYKEPVTLRLLTPITGTTSTISPNPAIPPVTSTLTIAPGAGVRPGHYDLTVQGQSISGTRSITLGLDIFTASPLSSTPLSPAQSAQEQSRQPTFRWSPVDQSYQYELEVASDPSFAQIIYRVPGLTESSHTPTQPLPSGHQLYWRVRASNACGVGGNSPTFTFTTVAAPGECRVGTTPVRLFHEDFEAGVGAWISGGVQSGQMMTDTWRLSDERTHSGSAAMYARGLDFVSTRYLISPPVTLPPGQVDYSLQFWNYQAMERVRSGGGCYDGGLLELSTDDGASWKTLPPDDLLTDPYDGPISGSYGNPLGGYRAWCGDPQDWLASVISLDPYAGQSLRFRFHVGTDEGMSREGWYVDDVLVQYCAPEPKSLFLPILTGGQ